MHRTLEVSSLSNRGYDLREHPRTVDGRRGWHPDGVPQRRLRYIVWGLGDPFRVDVAVWRSPGVLATLAPSGLLREDAFSVIQQQRYDY